MTSLWPRLPARAHERHGVGPGTTRTKVRHVPLHPAHQAPQRPGPAPCKPPPAAVALETGGDLDPDRKVRD